MKSPSEPSVVFQTVTINRMLVGSIAAILLVSAGLIWCFAGSQNIWTGACLKIGLVMSALWLALPTLSRHGNWGQISWGMLIGLLSLSLVLTGKKVDFRIVVPMLVGVAVTTMVLRPKSKARPK